MLDSSMPKANVAVVGGIADVAVPRRSGEAALDSVCSFLRRFVIFPSEEAATATTLWAAHTHIVDAFGNTPRLAFLSPEPASGKTRALEVLELLVPRPLHAVNATPAALCRMISNTGGLPTILFDEIDAVFGPKARGNEDLRAMLNAGHRRGATCFRCVVRAKSVEVEEFPAFAPVALAGLGDLPETILSRAVVIRMQRRARSEVVEPFRYRTRTQEGAIIKEELEKWAGQARAAVERGSPLIPEGVEDRAADVWEPLLAVAEAAGGAWPARARAAAIALVTQAQSAPASLGVQLLADLRDLRTQRAGEPWVATEALLEYLVSLDEAPWGDLRGVPIDARRLARLLAPYGARPQVRRVGTSTPRGYLWADLENAFSRYLPSLDLSPQATQTKATQTTETSAIPPTTATPATGTHGPTTETSAIPPTAATPATGTHGPYAPRWL